jgi:hypothetical protein
MNVAGIRALGLLDQALQHLRCRKISHESIQAASLPVCLQ